MAIRTSEVLRESIRHSPTSNTEVNAERLPGFDSLKGMELNFREEPATSTLQKPLLSFAFFSFVGGLYALSWQISPYVIEWLWHEVQSVEGMPVVAGMVAALLFVVAALSLVFVPKQILLAAVAISLPLISLTAASRTGHGAEGFVVGVLAAFVAGFSWKQSLNEFHDSWLVADPRMTSTQSISWKLNTKRGWEVPTLRDAGHIVWRYLTYNAPHAGAPGVWIAPSSLSARLGLAGGLAGIILALGSGCFDVVAYGLPMVFLSIAGPALALFAVTAWAVGEASWLTKEAERQLQQDQRSAFERHSDRLRQSTHVTEDVITAAPIREAEHLFLGKEPWQQFPILLHQSLLYEHVHISGRTGSGKTSMALMQMLTQLIRGHRSTGSQWSDKTPMVILDLKGDEVLFQTAKAEAEARGQKFRFFTLEPRKASFYFNPFLGFKSGTLSVPELVCLATIRSAG